MIKIGYALKNGLNNLKRNKMKKSKIRKFLAKTEEEAVKILTKYFGFEPKIEFKKVHN